MKPPTALPDTLRFAIGDQVYHKTEPGDAGVVTQIIFYPGGHLYTVQWKPCQSGSHYDIELNEEKGIE